VTSSNDIPATAFDLYPNPVRDQLTIHAASSVGELQFNLFDMQGKLMDNRIIDFSGSALQHVAIGEQVPGLYVVNLVNEHINTTIKIVIE
jgi:hypothetical protein